MINIERILIKYISIVFVAFYLSLNIINIARTQNKVINNRDYIYKKIQVTSTIQNINQPIFVYEDDLILLQFKVIDVKEILKTYNRNTKCQSIIKRLESLNNSVHYLDDFDKKEQFFCLRYIIGELLEDGKFILKDKKSNAIIKNITIEYYRWYKDILYGREGRLFFLPDGELFFEITDKLS